MSSSPEANSPLPNWPCHYTIRIRGRLDPHWSDWFNGLTLTEAGRDETTLSGLVIDQAALHGLLGRIRDLNLTLLSVCQGEGEQ